MPEHRGEHLPGLLFEHLAVAAGAGDQRVFLQPPQCFPDGSVVRDDQALVAADQGREADTLGCRERQVPAMEMLARAIAGVASELNLRIDPALEQFLEAASIHLAGEPQLLGGSTEPVRRAFLVMGVVIVLGEVAGRRHGRADNADRQHG